MAALTSLLAVITLSLLVLVANAQGWLNLAGENLGRTRALLDKRACSTLHPACTSCRLVRGDPSLISNSTLDELSTLTKPNTTNTGNGNGDSKPNGNGNGKATSILVCSACEQGWSLRRSDPYPTKCDCAAGLSETEPGKCGPCPKGKFCTGPKKNGGSAEPESCPFGLTTIITGAKSKLQCMTLSGYGRKFVKDPVTGHVTVVSELCDFGTYNTGSNTAGCQRCGTDMTTRGKGSGKQTDCTAPKGHFVQNGVARKCQKGTYAADFNDASFCSPCKEGLTTPTEGADSLASCSYAVRGMFVNAMTGDAEPCPLDTYSDVESNDTSCKPCPFGLKTEFTQSEGVAMCLAPPGFELRDWENATAITPCPVGWYKEGWNKNPCVKCGEGVLTDSTATTSMEGCYIPVGYGAVVSKDGSNVSAELCVENRFGYPVKMYSIKTAFCSSCDPNTFTMDVLTGVPALHGYTVPEDCKVQPGWGIDKTLQAVACRVGQYNEGFNRRECAQCPTQFTTLWEKANSSSQCVIKPGWAMDWGLLLPKPCDQGTYSTGGTLDNRGGACLPCPAGFTTQTDESVGAFECNVCSAGYGGAACDICPHGTYNTGGHSTELGCWTCTPGTTSARMAVDDTKCIPTMVNADNDYFPLSSDTAWVDQPGNTTNLACSHACDDTAACIMYRFATDTTTPKCQFLLEQPSGDHIVGFKAGGGMDYVMYSVDVSLGIGVLVSDEGSKTAEACMKSCGNTPSCELIRLDATANLAGPCKLYSSAMDADWLGMYHVQGNKLFSDGFVRPHAPGSTVVGEAQL